MTINDVEDVSPHGCDAAWDETDRCRFLAALPLPPTRSHASFVYLPETRLRPNPLGYLPTNHRWPRLRVESLPLLPLLGPHLSRRFRHRNRRRRRYRCRCRCRHRDARLLGSLRYRSTRDRLGNTHCPALHRSAPHRTVLRRAALRYAALRRTAPYRTGRSVGRSVSRVESGRRCRSYRAPSTGHPFTSLSSSLRHHRHALLLPRDPRDCTNSGRGHLVYRHLFRSR